MRKPGVAEFPDSVTQRGAKHLAELSEMVAQGHRAVMVFLIQRGDAARMKVARDIDPSYGAAYDRALKAGVDMIAYRCALSPESIALALRCPVKG